MSSPHVAGVVALIRSQRPDATPDEIRALLRTTARDVGAPGHDRLFGAGIVDAFAATHASPPGVRGVFSEPAPGAAVDAKSGVVAVRGSAEGPDFATFALSWGAGVDPGAWHDIPASGAPVSDGLLADWDVSGLPDGAYVLRLDVTSGAGEQVHEFLPLSLERNAPFAISSPGPPALAPDVSGRLVVWESRRTADGDELEPGEGRNVFASDLASGREIPIALDPGDQHAARVSGRRIAFLDAAPEAGAEIRTCRLERGACHPVSVASGPGPRSAPVVSGDLVLWTEGGPQDASVRLCDLRGGARACAPRPVAARPVGQLDLEVGGRRLVWRELGPTWSVRSCLLDPDTGSCPLQTVSVGSLPFAPVVSGDLFAWEDARYGWTRVYRCRLPASGDGCVPRGVEAEFSMSGQPDVSGDVLVWSAPAGDGTDAIFFCEVDPASGDCPEQRLSASLAGASHPAVDGRRVVFEDERDGPSRIYGFELPSLRVHAPRRVREGQPFVARIEGRDPSGAPMNLDATLADGAALEALGMHFAPRRDGTALLWWRPGRGRAGSYAVVLRGTTQGGLVTRRRLEIEVEAAGPARGPRPGHAGPDPYARGRGPSPPR
jgi:Subtilase family